MFGLHIYSNVDSDNSSSFILWKGLLLWSFYILLNIKIIANQWWTFSNNRILYVYVQSIVLMMSLIGTGKTETIERWHWILKHRWISFNLYLAVYMNYFEVEVISMACKEITLISRYFHAQRQIQQANWRMCHWCLNIKCHRSTCNENLKNLLWESTCYCTAAMIKKYGKDTNRYYKKNFTVDNRIDNKNKFDFFDLTLFHKKCCIKSM